jgi:hypothetical protein
VLVDSCIQLEKLSGKCLTLSFTQGWDPGGSALFMMVTTTQALRQCSGPGGRRSSYTSSSTQEICCVTALVTQVMYMRRDHFHTQLICGLDDAPPSDVHQIHP